MVKENLLLQFVMGQVNILTRLWIKERRPDNLSHFGDLKTSFIHNE